MNALYATFTMLGKNPEIGQARDDLIPRMRIFSVRNYVICFRTVSDAVEISRVVHGARQLELLF